MSGSANLRGGMMVALAALASLLIGTPCLAYPETALVVRTVALSVHVLSSLPILCW